MVKSGIFGVNKLYQYGFWQKHILALRERITAVVGDMNDLPFPDGSFGLLTGTERVPARQLPRGSAGGLPAAAKAAFKPVALPADQGQALPEDRQDLPAVPPGYPGPALPCQISQANRGDTAGPHLARGRQGPMGLSGGYAAIPHPGG